MFLQTGRLQQPKEVSFKVAAKYLQNFVSRKFGMFSASYNIVDGCGLSQYDLCSPQFMVDMLSLIYKDNELFPSRTARSVRHEGNIPIVAALRISI